MAFRSAAYGCGGLWRFLIARIRGRTAVQLERERNGATRAVIGLLPPGGELLEYEPCGRLRVIRIPQTSPPRTIVTRDVHEEIPDEPHQ